MTVSHWIFFEFEFFFLFLFLMSEAATPETSCVSKVVKEGHHGTTVVVCEEEEQQQQGQSRIIKAYGCYFCLCL